MPHFDIVKKVDTPKSFRVAAVMDGFDLQDNKIIEHFKGDLDLTESWNVGIIYGASGTGKTTIAKELFRDNYIDKFEYNASSVLDDMPANRNINEITTTFTKVGFGSVPSWLKPYSVLSSGEKMRVDLARAILADKDLIVFDEYTSVVNREVAKISSLALGKIIRKLKKKFIAVSCHDDILVGGYFNEKKLNWKSMSVKERCGNILESIII